MILIKNPTNSRKKLWYSLHVGSSHPLGNLSKISQANINAQADLTYQLRSDLNLSLIAGYSQFTTRPPLNINNPYWINASLNVQKIFPRIFSTKPYIKAGPGFYRNQTTSAAGANIGVGAIMDLSNTASLSAGLDVHRVFDDGKSSFINFAIGVLFR